MGFRFRRSISLGKELRINIGKRNASLGIGGRGLGVSIGTSGNWFRVGLPGSGLSYSSRIGGLRGPGRGASIVGVIALFLFLIWAFHFVMR
jgi:hypothetical protein